MTETRPPEQQCFTFDSVITPLPGGAWKLQAGRPRPVEDRVTVKQLAKEMGYSEDHARRIMKACALPYQRGKRCKLFITRKQLAEIADRRMELC